MNTATLMTFEQATEKHKQLKTIHSLTRSLLLEMRDRKGWLALGFESFEDYGEKEWGYSRSYIYRIARAEEIQQTICRQIGDKDIPESQLRELAKIPESERTAIYEQAKADAEAEGKEVTAKLIKEKADLEQQLKSKTSTLSALTNNFDNCVATAVNHQVEEKQAEMQKNLDELVARTEVENQAAISDLKITVQRLMQEKNDLTKQVNQDSNVETINKLNNQIASAQADLNDILVKKEQFNRDVEKMSVAIGEEKRANYQIYGVAHALAQDVHQHFKELESLCSAYVDDSEDDHLYPLYDLTFDTKDYLLEVVKVLRNTAKSIEFLANYSEQPVELDAIDKTYLAMEGFFRHWKTFRNSMYKPGDSNDYDSWLSWLKRDPDKRITDAMVELFPKIWERYQFQIQAINN